MWLLLMGCVVLLACALATRQLLLHLPRRAALLISGAMLAGLVGMPLLLAAAYLGEPDVGPDVRRLDYEKSERCLTCHPNQYATWHDTYHRTMTQDVAPDRVRGDFDGAQVTFGGFVARFLRREDGFYMDVVDPEWERRYARRPGDREPERRVYRVDRMVGSHHQQVYLSRQKNGEYAILPFVWSIDDGSWRPLNANFLEETDGKVHARVYANRWNSVCAFCHNTRARPGMQLGPFGVLEDGSMPGVSWSTELEEIGIACEACHGPGEVHSRVNHNLVRRMLVIERGEGDPTILNARRMNHRDSVNMCGRCHGKWTRRPEYLEEALTTGDLYIPGRPDLKQIFQMIRIDSPEEYEPEGHRNYLWPEGSPRATALEFQGTIGSPCYLRGEMSCLSCHAMHDSDPDRQLLFPEDPATPEHEGNEACTQCHPQYRGPASLEAHTRHPAESNASQCVTCHMPYQVYGIMASRRSHRIQNPNASASADHDLPIGCNQCHVDQTLGWTAEWLEAWYGQPPPALEGDRARVSETIYQLEKGHALSRAIAVQTLGDPLAWEAAPGTWRVPFLTDGLEDSYPPVRHNAFRSLRRVDGFEDADFEFFASEERRAREVAAIRSRWEDLVRARREEGGSPLGGGVPDAVPLGADGWPDAEIRSRLQAERDHTPLMIAE